MKRQLRADSSYNLPIMMDTAKLFVFLTAAFLLAIAPGPGMLYVLARSLAGGKREGALSAVGTFVGGMVHVFAAAAGVSVILAKSAAAFAAVKYAGAAYLGFLGIRMILEAHRDTGQSQDTASTDATPPRREISSLSQHLGKIGFARLRANIRERMIAHGYGMTE